MNTQRLDDADIAQLVHDVADDWTMPPMRLDAPAWRDRIRSPRARQRDAIRGWFGRLGQAATAAVAVTVAAALVAVVITLPPDPGKSPAPSDRSSPSATDAARPTPLPKRLLYGDLPSPSKVIVRTEVTGFAVADLAEGSIGPGFVDGRFGSELQAREEGRLMCLCLTESGSGAGSPTTLTVTLRHYEADGTEISSATIRSFEGLPDPRDEGVVRPDPLPNVLTALTFSEGGHYGFVGWSRRIDTSWESGVLVVDLLDGSVDSELPLPDMTGGDEDSRRVVEAPRVVSSMGDELVIARSWYEFTPPDSDSAIYTFDMEAFRASMTVGILGDLVAVPNMAGCGDTIRFAGVSSDGGTWVVCSRGGAESTRLRRVAGDGSSLPDVIVPGEPGIAGDATAVSRDGRTLFAWNPAAATMTRVDIATGETRTGQGLVARADAGPLEVLGRWLAPVAAAKSFLHSSVVISPDGSRVYALGVRDGEGPEVAGSTGAFVFDATTIEPLAVYEPTADFVSLAISTDGRFLYAAGLPGFDAIGRRQPSQGPSITVFDTADHSIRLIAGQLGGGVITFGPEPLG